VHFFQSGPVDRGRPGLVVFGIIAGDNLPQMRFFFPELLQAGIGMCVNVPELEGDSYNLSRGFYFSTVTGLPAVPA